MDFSITERGVTHGVLTVQLRDGSSFFIAKELWAALPEPPQTREELEFLACETLARKKALDLLARRDHSRGELSIKLLQRNFDPAAVEKALEWLAFKGYLNDEKFARHWVTERLRKHPEGVIALEGGLRSKGISLKVIRLVLGDLTITHRRDAFLRAREKVLRRQSDPDKIRAALVRRGFGSADFKLADLSPVNEDF